MRQVMVDSMNTPSPRQAASSWAPRRVLDQRQRPAQARNPATPPPRSRSSRRAPISRVKMMTRVWPGSPKTSTRLWMAAAVPLNTFPPTMTQPTQTPASSDGTAWRLTTARPIASSGGMTESQPYGCGSILLLAALSVAHRDVVEGGRGPGEGQGHSGNRIVEQGSSFGRMVPRSASVVATSLGGCL